MTTYDKPYVSEGRSIVVALLSLCAAVVSIPATAAAYQLKPQQLTYYKSGTETARLQFLMQLIANDRIDVVESLLQQVPLQGPLAANRTLYLRGLIQEKHGELKAAAATYRSVLANAPSLSMVRLSLAKVLAAQGEVDSANHHLDLLASETRDSRQAAEIRTLQQDLKANQPFNFSAFVSLAPSTNVNQGSNHDTVKLEILPGLAGDWAIANKKVSGVGVSLGGSVSFHKSIYDHVEVVASAGAAGSAYLNSNADWLTLSQSAEVRIDAGKGYLGLGGSTSEALIVSNDPLVHYSYGPRISFTQMVSEQNRLSTSISYEWQQRRETDISGVGYIWVTDNVLSGSAVLTHAFDATSNVALITSLDRGIDDADFNSYYAATGGLGFYKEFAAGMTTEGQGTIRYARFDAAMPGTLAPREDIRLATNLNLTKRDWNWFGFAPSLTYSYVRNFSNVANYDFDSHSVDFRLTKNF